MSWKNGDDEDDSRHGIRLPGSILDKIKQGPADDDDRFTKFETKGKKRKEKPVTRKEKRKQERELKKQKRSKKTSQSTAQPKNQDPLAALAELKKNRNGSKILQEEDPMEALRKLKEKKSKAKSTDDGFKIVREEDLEDDEISDLSEEEDEEDGEEDPMETLRKLKESKNGKKPTTDDGYKIVREEDLEQDDDISDFDEEIDSGFDEEFDEEFDENEEDEQEEDPMEALHDEISEEDDFEGDNLSEEDDFADFDEEDEEEELVEEPNPLAKLKALKESKKSKSKSEPKPLTPQQQELFKRDEDDIDYYAKKLGLKSGKKSKLAKQDDDDIIGGLLDGLDLDFGSESEQEEEEKEEEDDDEIDEDDFDESGELDEEPRERENPYVAPGTDTTNEPKSETAEQRYIPPALRRKMAMEQETAVSEEVVNLRKSIKGPLNKLSEANINSIINDINSLFLSHPRHTLNEEITNIILDSIIHQGRLLDTFVYLHACVVVALYRLQGVEFGAHFIQTIVQKFESLKQDDSKTREASNLVSLLSSVYLFQLVSSKLLYDLIKTLISDLNETNADLLLRLIRNSGNQMRSDDPTALKDIVLLINEKYSSLPKSQINTRTQFLIETISSLKNNKLKVVNEANHQLSIRLKKVLGGINNNKFNDPIQVSLDDIHSIESRGKWWLVGSAWKGVEQTTAAEDVDESVMNDILDHAEPNWMELAKSQRMNTDIRRAIFISIMSATDYIDAVTKLDKLALKRAQEREIPKILTHCAVMEPSWNPYYGILGTKLCESHSHRKTFQFILWDLIKELDGGDREDEDEDDFLGFDNDDDETKLRRILNLGRFYGSLIAEGSIPLHNLRTVNFLTASSDTVLLMEVLLVSFLDTIGKKSQKNSIGAGLNKKKSSEYEQKFDDKLLVETVLRAKDQTTLLRGLQYFLQEKVKTSDIISGKKQKARVAWGVDALFDIIDEILKESEQV
ncbi:uncharacterized protein SPAPADRAFT_148973 [Spathaspora passalidarum NRRL Y-27907]|uniref:MI domain-containing protein n=1 Tax=Spathaspora passalidarum (strain NRRL Y-27907 / 11-Y1) TaxID=619300 RepID=G3AHY8_SPAPN|nr:uncharacterized protein SPAPADRAFT_148973 [Spathaspora passalidarum NRRL Y-27907]EGW34302.1 hypothetical protein SPAPADRAFT_148973 [Spathaspora passalidarum NRRL Y-27907]